MYWTMREIEPGRMVYEQGIKVNVYPPNHSAVVPLGVLAWNLVWMTAGVTLSWMVASAMCRWSLRRWRRARGRCAECGYQGVTIAGCTECGEGVAVMIEELRS